MSINWVRFALSIVAVFMAYFMVYEGIFAVLGLKAQMEPLMRSPEDPIIGAVMGGHLVQSILIVLLYHAFVKTNDLKTGAMYGLIMGIYFAATQITQLAFKDFPEALVWDYLPIHLIAGIICAGLVPALIYKPASVGGSDDADNGTEHA